MVGDFRLQSKEKMALNEVIAGGRISEWHKVKEFQTTFARYVGTKYCVAVSSGTAALITGLLALLYDNRFPKAKKGAKIITSPLTYIATANAIVLAGFEPVFIDVNKKTFVLDLEQLNNALKEHGAENIAGILPVHLMGYPNDMDEINAIAKNYDLFVFEDSAQAHGSLYKGKKTGSLGLMAGFSFYIAHNIQAGELGCITTNDKKLFKLATQLKANGRICNCPVCTRNQGICPGTDKYGLENDDYDPRFTHEYITYNFKTMEFPAALGLIQVKKADWIFQRRQENIRYLSQGLKKFQDLFYLPIVDNNISYLAFPLCIKEGINIKRKWLRMKLEEMGIENRPLFGCIPTQQPSYAYLKEQYQDKLPVADYLGKNAFYIGCHQYLKKDDLDFVIEVFNEIFKKEKIY